MIVVEILLFCGLISFGIYASISDFRTGRIANNAVIIALLYAVSLDIVYYGFFVSDTITDFLINNAIILCVISVLYFSKTWAGGDCKFCFVIALLYPARYYVALNGSIATLSILIAFSFLIGYLYLVWDAVYCLMLRRIRITKNYFLRSVTRFFLSYFSAIIYITACSFAVWFLSNKTKLELSPLLQILLYSCIAWIVSSKKELQNKYLLGLLFVVDVAICIYTKTVPISSDYKIYIVVVLLLFLQILIRLRNYETIPAEKVKARMILSIMSSMMLVQSKIPCFHDISKENLGSRLSEEQAEAIRKWGYGTQIELTIVRKIPFAVFIVLGAISYFIMWSIVR